ncbi:MAG: RNA polymerase sigma factor RpoS, partial [Comamonadaceae bacterium]
MGQGVPLPPEGDSPEADRTDAEAPARKDLTADLAGESTDTLTLYLRDVRRTELFTPQEEFETATRARAGDFAARARVAVSNSSCGVN